MSKKMDWSLLPPELLHIVSKKLPDIANFVRFRAVCTRWRSSAPASDPPSQLPWLVGRRKVVPAFGAELHFYSLASQKTYVVRNRAGRSRLHASGACQGYIVSVDLSTVILYNPVNGTHLVLPRAPYPPWHGGVIHLPTPIGSDDCVVVNTCLPTRQFAFCRPGDTKWNIIEGHKDMRQHAYYNGMFFVNRAAGGTMVIDATTLAVVSVVPPPSKSDGDIDYLVESSGKLLRVVQHGGRPTSADGYHFDVYRLDFRCEQTVWTKVRSIGNCVFFFDDHSHGFCFSSNDSAGLRGDCIYFIHEKRTWVDVGECRFLCRYSLEDGKVDKIVPLPEMLGDTWIVPSLC